MVVDHGGTELRFDPRVDGLDVDDLPLAGQRRAHIVGQGEPSLVGANAYVCILVGRQRDLQVFAPDHGRTPLHQGVGLFVVRCELT